MQYDLERIRRRLAQEIDRELYEHSLRTEQTARELACRYGADELRASLAGLLHDYGRKFPDETLPAVAAELGLPVDDIERQHPYLLHGPVGARLIPSAFGVSDNDVLEAVATHTVGAPGMTLLQKVIYLADLVEPGRIYAGLDEVRACLYDVDCAVRAAYEHVLAHLVRSGKPIHPAAVAVWNEIRGTSRPVTKR